MNKKKHFIHQIHPEQVTPAHRALFNLADPASLRCFAILDGSANGRIFTNHQHNPTWAMVQEAAFGSLYLGGNIQHRLIRRIIGRLRHCGNVLVGLWQEDPRWSLMPTGADYSGKTLEFSERENHSSLPQIPEGGELRRLDQSLFRHILSQKLLISMFGSAEQALEGGFGLCYLQNGEILCEAFAGPSASGIIEIGVECHPRHYHKGYATLTCSHLIQAMERQGYSTYWNCAKGNQASIALARKLGYQKMKEYCLKAWSRWDF
jgi:RimJ/RimL family protein N-acetyltransferase